MKKERLERQEHYKSERKDEKGRARETRVRDRMKKKGLERQEQDNSERQFGLVNVTSYSTYRYGTEDAVPYGTVGTS